MKQKSVRCVFVIGKQGASDPKERETGARCKGLKFKLVNKWSIKSRIFIK